MAECGVCSPEAESGTLSVPVVPSFRALSGRLKLTVRRHKLNKDSRSVTGVHPLQLQGPALPRRLICALAPLGTTLAVVCVDLINLHRRRASAATEAE